MYYDVSKSEELEEPWDKQTEHKQINLTTQHIIIGKQGTAMNVEPNTFISE